MAKTYPLKPITPKQYVGKSPSAVTNQVNGYRNMLGVQAAIENVGLFYQLNSVADQLTEESKYQGQTVNGQTPIEANARLA